MTSKLAEGGTALLDAPGGLSRCMHNANVSPPASPSIHNTPSSLRSRSADPLSASSVLALVAQSHKQVENGSVHLIPLVPLPEATIPMMLTFFFSSTEMPPGPIFTRSNNPPTMAKPVSALHRFTRDSYSQSVWKLWEKAIVNRIQRGRRYSTHKSYLRKSLCGWAEWTDHQLLMNTLNTLNSVTRNEALHLALKPTATMMQAPRPTMETMTRANDQFPWKMNPMKRKMSRIRPANWKL